MQLIPFDNLIKQKLNLVLGNKNLEIELLNINNRLYINVSTEDETLINGLQLSNLYPLKINGLDGAFLLDRDGDEIGINVFIYFLEKDEIPTLFGG